MMWLDRCLFLGPRVALVTSQRQFQRALRSIDALADSDPYCLPHQHACVHSYDVDGELVCIVAVNAKAVAAMASIDTAAVLVHEAVHVWQRIRDTLGAGDLGREMEAYAVQNIAAALMRAWLATSSCSSPASAPKLRPS